MGCNTLHSTSPALQEAIEAVMTIVKNDAKLREARNSQAESIKQSIHTFNEIIEEYEMSTLYLGDSNSTKYYFRQARQHIESIRRLSEEIDLTLASIQSLDSSFAQLIKPYYAQFLRDVMGLTGSGAQAFATLNTIAKHFRILNKERQARFASMSEQLDRYTTAMAEVIALKHDLEEKDMI